MTPDLLSPVRVEALDQFVLIMLDAESGLNLSDLFGHNRECCRRCQIGLGTTEYFSLRGA